MNKAAGAVCLLWLGFGLAAPLFDSAAVMIDLGRILEAPRVANWCGQDDLGRSVAARLFVGARLSLGIACGAVLTSAVLGTLIGAVAGWFGGIPDLLIGRVVEVFLAFPGILLAIALAGLMGPGAGNVTLALVAVGWVGFARLARAQVLALRQREHLMVARALGTPLPRQLARHVLPLMAGPLLVEATFALAAVIVAEAGLSFLGLGVQPPAPSWGAMIRDGMRYLLIAPHLVLVPCIALMSLVLAVNALADGLRERLAPSLRHG